MLYFRPSSAQKVSMDAPAHIDARQAAQQTEEIGRSEAKAVSEPPPDPAEYGYAEENADFVHSSELLKLETLSVRHRSEIFWVRFLPYPERYPTR